MKRLTALFITTALIAVAGVMSACNASAVTLTSPAFFFSPHQDDEVLFMGAAIRQHVLAGRKVYVVLLTDGGSSRYCIPQYGTRAACTAARDKEFINGVTSMGAEPIIRADRMIDGTLTVAYAKSVILEYYATYPTGSFKTMSEFDASPDHSNLGKGLAAANIVDSRWYIKRSEWATHAGTLTPRYNMNATLNLYPFGRISVPADFASSTYPTGNYSKVYAH